MPHLAPHLGVMVSQFNHRLKKCAWSRWKVDAKQTHDGELIGYATKIRKRPERRLGELMEANRKTGKLAKGNAVKGARPGSVVRRKVRKARVRPDPRF
jgi:hypothetical protein